MKIISDFKDYYDSVSGQYLDKEVKFIRKTSSLEISPKDLPRLEFLHSRTFTSDKVALGIVGFCGSYFPFVSVEDEVSKNYFYNIEDVLAYHADNNLFARGFFYTFSGYSCTEKGITSFFKSRENYPKLDGFFRKYNTPYFILEPLFRSAGTKYTLRILPILRKFSFVKVKNPYSAHQEIYQYLTGGFLDTSTRPMVTISDKDKIHKHGYDKWSFRKQKNN